MGRAGPEGDPVGSVDLHQQCSQEDGGQGPGREQHRHHRYLQF